LHIFEKKKQGPESSPAKAPHSSVVLGQPWRGASPFAVIGMPACTAPLKVAD
jgi:hypothetical protein